MDCWYTTESTIGFAKIKNVTTEKPAGEHNFVKAVAYISHGTPDTTTLHITWPFEEFYLEESKAPKAEADYREANRNPNNKTYALVKVLDGAAVIENVYINDNPLMK